MARKTLLKNDPVCGGQINGPVWRWRGDPLHSIGADHIGIAGSGGEMCVAELLEGHPSRTINDKTDQYCLHRRILSLENDPPLPLNIHVNKTALTLSHRAK